MVCHIHPGTNMLTTYFGLTWWDNELDGDKMYPPQAAQSDGRAALSILLDVIRKLRHARGLWSDEKFLENLGSPEFNAKLKTTQFADFHGHGWVFRSVFKHDRKGNWLDKDDNQSRSRIPQRFSKAVHLADIHLEKGMQCTDCHFEQDNHGNGKIYGETRTAVEIDCVELPRTIRINTPTLNTSGPAAPDGGTNLARYRTPWGIFAFLLGKRWSLYQRSMLTRT